MSRYIRFERSVYDVSDFLDKHPGGREVIEDLCVHSSDDAARGPDRWPNFVDVGHSKAALRTLSELPRTVNVQTDAHHVRTHDGIEKLFTREDRFFIHKIAGLFCLLHYAYRIGYSVYELGTGQDITAGFGTSWVTPACVCMHLYLSLSSLIFHVPRDQPTEKPMIWKEFRMHSILFASRNAVCALLAWYEVPYWARALVVMCTLVAADLATNAIGANEKKTTRTMPYWDGCSPIVQRNLKRYYRVAQFESTLSACFGSVGTALLTALPIQLAAFLLTCVRKGLLTSKQYHALYLASLLTPQILYMTDGAAHIVLAVSILMAAARPHVSKYVLWPVVLGVGLATYSGC